MNRLLFQLVLEHHRCWGVRLTTLNKHTANWTERSLGFGMLPIPWQQWPEPVFAAGTVAHGGSTHDYQLHEQHLRIILQEILDLSSRPIFSGPGGAPLPLGAFVEAETTVRVKAMLMTIGPLLPGTASPFQSADAFGRPVLRVVGPTVVAVANEADEMRQVFLGMKVLEALNSGRPEVGARYVREAGSALVNGMAVEALEATAVAFANSWNTPRGDLGLCLQWLGHMATRWPMVVRGDPRYRSRLVPVPASPSQVIWLTFAHQAGALDLPYPRSESPVVGECAECGKFVFSDRPRNTGERMFCDPLPAEDRSVCGNRFHSRESRARSRAHSFSVSGMSTQDIARKMGRSEQQITEWLARHKRGNKR